MRRDEIIDVLDLMIESIHLVQERFSEIHVPDDFVLSPTGMTLLDAISMRLQVLGESVKRIGKLDPSFFGQYGKIEWEKIARLRDLVSHHYEQVDHEIIFDICHTHIPVLSGELRNIRDSLLSVDSSDSR